MLTDAYASVPEYRVWKSSGKDDLFLGWLLEAVSRMLDVKLNQPYSFNKDIMPTTRLYQPPEVIVPIAETAGLVVKVGSGRPIDWDATTPLVLDTDYELTPRNPAAGWPYTGIHILWSSAAVPLVPSTYGVAGLTQVTAIHGWPTVPRAIQRATLELTAILEQDSIFLTNRVQEIDGVIEASPQARGILKSLASVYNPYPIAVG